MFISKETLFNFIKDWDVSMIVSSADTLLTLGYRPLIHACTTFIKFWGGEILIWSDDRTGNPISRTARLYFVVVQSCKQWKSEKKTPNTGVYILQNDFNYTFYQLKGSGGMPPEAESLKKNHKLSENLSQTFQSEECCILPRFLLFFLFISDIYGAGFSIT